MGVSQRNVLNRFRAVWGLAEEAKKMMMGWVGGFATGGLGTVMAGRNNIDGI